MNGIRPNAEQETKRSEASEVAVTHGRPLIKTF